MKRLPLALSLSLLGLLPLHVSAQGMVAGSLDRPSKLSLPPRPLRLVMLGDHGENGIPDAKRPDPPFDMELAGRP